MTLILLMQAGCMPIDHSCDCQFCAQLRVQVRLLLAQDSSHADCMRAMAECIVALRRQVDAEDVFTVRDVMREFEPQKC